MWMEISIRQLFFLVADDDDTSSILIVFVECGLIFEMKMRIKLAGWVDRYVIPSYFMPIEFKMPQIECMLPGYERGIGMCY